MDNVIRCTAELHCQPHEAYKYFISNSLLETWLTKMADVEVFVGGKYELFWNPADRDNDSTIGCRITVLEPDSLLAFEWRSPKQFKHFTNTCDPLTHVVVAFIPTSFGTIVHLVHSGWRSSPEWQEAAAWQERAWSVAFRELEKRVNVS
jgi:uncharacterized protein YndB with AHSA1/START domain